MRSYHNFINNQFVAPDGDARFFVVDPASGQPCRISNSGHEWMLFVRTGTIPVVIAEPVACRIRQNGVLAQRCGLLGH